MVSSGFERVERTRRLLPSIEPAGLVAVFTCLDRDDLLLIYLDEASAAAGGALAPPGTTPPGTTPPGPPSTFPLSTFPLSTFPPSTFPPGTSLHTTTLARGLPVDRSVYDGPVLALAAIDQLPIDLTSKGLAFYRLDRLLRRAGHLAEVRATMAGLADYLDGAQTVSPEHAARAAVERQALRVPALLASLGPAELDGLVAYLPRQRRAVRFDPHAGTPSLEALAVDDLAPDDVVVALAEVRDLVEARRPRAERSPYSVELRTVLHRTDLGAGVPTTLNTLAQAFHDSWRRHGRPADLTRAYALALEARLMDGDVDDLIAVVPSHRFGDFLDRGAGTYVYRRPLEGGRDRAAGGVVRVHLDAYRHLGPTPELLFSLAPVREHLVATCSDDATGTGGAAVRWADLGPVLRSARRTEILARNAWLLVEDLLDAGRERRTRYRVQPETLLQTVQCSVELLGLTDPWRVRQGRRTEWLDGARATVHRVLAVLIDRAAGHAGRTAALEWAYYTALDLWYGCSAQEDAEVHRRIVELVRVLERAATVPRQPDDDAGPLEGRSAELLALGRLVRDVLDAGLAALAPDALPPPRPTSVPMLLTAAAAMSNPLPPAGETFWSALRGSQALAQQVRLLQTGLLPVAGRTRGLTQQLARLRAARRQLFAPAHQLRVLRLILDTEIEATARAIEAVQGRVALQLDLVTRSVAAGTDHAGLVLRVRNAGNAPARRLEAELAASDALAVRDGADRQTCGDLASGEERDVRFPVRVVTDDDSLTVHFAVRSLDDAGAPQYWNAQFPLRVDWVDPAGFAMRPNPYFFGPKVHAYQQFFGRRRELHDIVDHLAAGGSQAMLVRGARRTGKSSLLSMVAAVLRDRVGGGGGPRAVRDWFDVPTHWDAALDRTVAVELDLQGSDLVRTDPSPAALYRACVDALDGAGLASADLAAVVAAPEVTATRFTAALRRLVDAVPDRHLVVLLDEFDILFARPEAVDVPSFYNQLRHVITAVPRVTWVIASALGLTEQVGNYASPLFNSLATFTLGPLGEEAAAQLVRAPWQGRAGRTLPGPPLQFADDAVLAVVEECGQHPYFVQMLCSYLVDWTNRTRSNYVQHHTVLQVIEQMVVREPGGRQYLDYMWRTAGPLGQAILLELLAEPGPVPADTLHRAVTARWERACGAHGGDPVATGAYDTTLKQLVDISAVRELPHLAYEFAVPLLRRVVLRRSELDDAVDAALRHLDDGQGRA